MVGILLATPKIRFQLEIVSPGNRNFTPEQWRRNSSICLCPRTSRFASFCLPVCFLFCWIVSTIDPCPVFSCPFWFVLCLSLVRPAFPFLVDSTLFHLLSVHWIARCVLLCLGIGWVVPLSVSLRPMFCLVVWRLCRVCASCAFVCSYCLGWLFLCLWSFVFPFWLVVFLSLFSPLSFVPLVHSLDSPPLGASHGQNNLLLGGDV